MFNYVRGIEWEKETNYLKAIEDYERSILLFPKSVKAKNNLTWLLITKEELQSLNRDKEAFQLAKEVIEVHPVPNNLDTYACACALIGKYKEAVRVQKKIVEQTGSDAFRLRLEKFKKKQNCIGED